MGCLVQRVAAYSGQIMSESEDCCSRLELRNAQAHTIESCSDPLRRIVISNAARATVGFRKAIKILSSSAASPILLKVNSMALTISEEHIIKVFQMTLKPRFFLVSKCKNLIWKSALRSLKTW